MKRTQPRLSPLHQAIRAALLAGAAASSAAQAQTSPAPPAAAASAPAAETSVEKIIVYGTKAPLSEQETTGSVEVLTARRLERLGAVELKDVLQRVGNTGITTTGSGRFEQFVIRGVPSAGVTPSATPVATLYLDGAPIPEEIYTSAVSNAWDVSQFELLRGAQSTLLGRNSLIGAIYVRTADPSFAPTAKGAWRCRVSAAVRSRLPRAWDWCPRSWPSGWPRSPPAATAR
jgi:iron complex outermembrane recepter protein